MFKTEKKKKRSKVIVNKLRTTTDQRGKEGSQSYTSIIFKFFLKGYIVILVFIFQFMYNFGFLYFNYSHLAFIISQLLKLSFSFLIMSNKRKRDMLLTSLFN